MRGGYRQGAGRKRGFAAKSAEEARRVFSETVATEITPIAKALITKAKKGDVRAIKELLDRAWGRPSQSAEITYRPMDLSISKEASYRIAKRTVEEYEKSNFTEAP